MPGIASLVRRTVARIGVKIRTLKPLEMKAMAKLKPIEDYATKKLVSVKGIWKAMPKRTKVLIGAGIAGAGAIGVGSKIHKKKKVQY